LSVITLSCTEFTQTGRMSRVNLFGHGFVGKEFTSKFPETVVNERNDLYPKLRQILYMISTVDNYNVKINPLLDIDTNLTTLIRVLDNARIQFGSNPAIGMNFEFNFVSSWFVYGKTNDLPAKEDSICNPQGFYSITKRCAEQLLISYCSTYKIPYRILRLPNVLGIGDRKVGMKKNFVQHMIRELVRGEEVKIYNGQMLRDFLHVSDVVEAIDLVLDKGNLNEIYNIGGGVGYSVEEIAYEMWYYLGTGSIARIPVPDFHKTIQVADMYMDNTKLVNLGFHPKKDVKQSLREIADFYKKENK
jgi:nucleoside-diphosphate-sugar epimerase